MALPPFPTVLHPILVHFTIGLVPTAAAFAAWYAWREEEWARRAAYAVLTGAAILALFTMGSGFRDYLRVAPLLEGTPVRETLEWHERLGVVTAVTLVVTAALAWWRRRDVATRASWRWALAVALVVATLLVGVTGWYGGSLVYDSGVSVTDTTPGV